MSERSITQTTLALLDELAAPPPAPRDLSSPAQMQAARMRCERAVMRLGGWIVAAGPHGLTGDGLRRLCQATAPSRYPVLLGWAATLERQADRAEAGLPPVAR